MAESKKKGMISGMESLLSISGEELLEVIRLEKDGTFKNYKLMVSKIRNNQGLSAYEIAVQNGFVGTAEEWLESLKGKSAYQIAVELGFVGDEAAFIKSLKGAKGDRGDEGQSIYDIALQNGFVGTEEQFLKTLVGKSAYQSAVDQGYPGTEAQWVASLKGAKGDTGAKGEQGVAGKSAFQVWQEQPGNAGKPMSEYLASIKGEEGLSAYEVAKAGGFVGTEQQWLASLVGASAYETYKKQPGNANKTEAEFLKSLEGLSAYQVAVKGGYVGTEAEWLKSLVGLSAYEVAKKNGFVGTESAWLASLEGSDGADGAKGESAYETWLKQPGNAGKPESAFITSLKGKDGTNGTNGTDGEDGADGKTAYEVWVALPGNEGKNEAEFFASLKGKDGTNGTNGTDGVDGDSAYEIALSHGFVGTEAAWIESLKGKQGETGKALNIIATVEQDEFDQIVAEGLSEPGDGYIVGKFLYAYNGTDWVKSNSLEGPKGQGLNYLGQWPDNLPLPMGDNYVAGDTYVWKNQGVTSLWTLVVTPVEGQAPKREWVDIGVPGPKGDSAYESWLKQPGNAGKPESEFVLSIKGAKGDKGEKGEKGTDGTNGVNGKDGTNGDDGASAYEIAVSGGFVGTEAQWLESLHGEKGDTGDKGDPALAFEIKGRVTNASELPRPGKPSEAYYVGTDLYIWITADNEYSNFGSLNGDSAYIVWTKQPGNAGKTEEEFIASITGKSAYQVWVEQPANVGKTEEDFLASLKGKDGTNGTNGEDGVDGLDGKSAYQSWLDIPGNEGKTEPEFVASLKGADGVDGTDGENGKSAYEIWLTKPGNAGKTEDEFIASTQGKDGRNLEILGSQPNLAAIEALPDPKDQDAWTAVDNGHLYIYVTDTWIDAGRFRGTDGVDGKDGEQGASAFEAYKAIPGNENKTEEDFIVSITGKDGKDGTNGTNGKDGRNVVIKGSVANQAALPTGAAEQDAYTTKDTGNLYMWISGAWIDLGQFHGDKGEQGEKGETGDMGRPGIGLNIVAQYETLAERPDASTLEPGDAVYVLEDHKVYQVNDAGTYNPGIEIVGEKGDKGDKGEVGPVGPAIKIMGKFNTEQELIAANPPQVHGEGYIVDKDLWLPNGPGTGDPKFYNAGPIQGPKGDKGEQGVRGLTGAKGIQGPRGSLWLNMGDTTPGAMHGTQGDWAVTNALDVYYKQTDTSWVNTGKLTGGDMWSPDLGLGKVIRLGTEWIALPVDEVPSIEDGKFYVRAKKAGGEAGEGEWVEMPVTEFPEPTADGKLYGRSKADAGTDGEWQEIVFPEGIADLTAKDDKQYVRTFKAAAPAPEWVELVIPASGIPEAPTTTGKTYVRSGENKNWVEYVAGITAPADAKKYLRTKDAWVALDSYDLAYATGVTFDLSKNQMIEVDNTTAAARAIVITNAPEAGRCTTAVIVVKGAGTALDAFTWNVNGTAFPAANIKWNGGTAPTLLAGYNVLTLLVYKAGTSFVIIGAAGAQTPAL